MSTTFSIMTKPPGFFFQGGHESSDDELIAGQFEDEIAEPDEYVPDQEFKEEFDDNRFTSSRFSDDIFEGGIPDFDSLIDPVEGGESFDNIFGGNEDETFDELFD